MGKGAVWLFAFGAIVIELAVSFITNKIGLTNKAVGLGLFAGIWGACGYLGVYLTKASKGQGVVAFLVSSLAMAITMYFFVAILLGAATAELTTTTGQLAGADARLTAQAAQAAGNGIGAFFGIVVALVSFLIAFLSGMTGALTGGAAKTKAIGASGAPLRQAA
jgi:hypothetical protein